ncbi:MAG: ArnT family glycosyltransferase [Candidatus Nanopelagicales bacterium]
MTRLSDRSLKVAALVVSFAVYVGFGYWVQVSHGLILGDSLSRVYAAQSVLFSRDPHLAAIGFIFTPLTAAIQVPIIALTPLFPALAERALSASIMSALFMAGAVMQIFSMGTDRGLPRWYSVTITTLFALHPMILFYGSNGMSEAPFVFFITWAVRRLILWMVDDDIHHLIAAGGIAMGLAYLTRYDALACIAAAGVVVAATTYLRAPGPPRIRRALLDLIIISAPGSVAFLGWAVASWLITGEAFAQFTSQYGNAAILKQSGAVQVGPIVGLGFAATCILLLAPTLIPLAGWAGFTRWRRPRAAMLIPPIAVFGAALAFQSLTYAAGGTFAFLRFYIIAVPFAATMALLAVPDGVFVTSVRPGRHAPVPSADRSTSTRGGYVAAAGAFAVCLVAGGWGMTQPKYAPQEYALEAVIDPEPDSVSPKTIAEDRIVRTFSTERMIARYLDDMNLPDGSVITDSVYGFAVIAPSRRPKVFVVPSDPDFVRILSDPAVYGVKYLLAVPPNGRGKSDALNLRYPTLYETGAEIATLALEIPNDGEGQPNWRLYRVNEPVGAV